MLLVSEPQTFSQSILSWFESKLNQILFVPSQTVEIKYLYHSLLHLLIQHLLNTSQVPGTLLGFGNATMNKTRSINSKEPVGKDSYICFLQYSVIILSTIGLYHAMESRKMEDSFCLAGSGISESASQNRRHLGWVLKDEWECLRKQV